MFTIFKKHILLVVIALLCVPALHAQKFKGGHNLEKFDLKHYHFGFILGFNRSSYNITYKPDYTFQDSILGVENMPQAGFNLALLASLDMTKNLHLRFVPGLSFQDRGLNYRAINEEGKYITQLQRTEAVYLDFPLNFKFRTNRVGNFAAYALFGAKYSIDMQTQKDTDNSLGDLILKTESSDYSIDFGAGVDFFLPYFKFGIELKSAVGLKDILIHEDIIYTRPLESLKTRSFIVSFTFEG